MRLTDREEFGAVMRDIYQSIGQGEPYTEGGLDIMFAAMQDLSLQQIQQALVHHLNDRKNGKWRPNVAMIREQIEKRAPVLWVSADEAWATVPKLERDAGIINQVSAAALAVAQPLINDGDMVAARRSFIDAYNARVEVAKTHPDPAQRIPITFISGGNLPQRDDDAHGEQRMLLERAQSAGLLPAPQPVAVPQIAHTRPSARAMQALAGFRPKSFPLPGAEE